MRPLPTAMTSRLLRKKWRQSLCYGRHYRPIKTVAYTTWPGLTSLVYAIILSNIVQLTKVINKLIIINNWNQLVLAKQTSWYEHEQKVNLYFAPYVHSQQRKASWVIHMNGSQTHCQHTVGKRLNNTVPGFIMTIKGKHSTQQHEKLWRLTPIRNIKSPFEKYRPTLIDDLPTTPAMYKHGGHLKTYGM